MAGVDVTIFTDPGCPFGFNAQRQEAQLLWHYGDGLRITRRMIVLSDRSRSLEEAGLRREMLAATNERLRERYGMPMLTDPPDRLAATIDGCRAYVAARIHEPASADGLLRAMRRLAFSDGRPLDDPRTIRDAAERSGIDPAQLDAWLADGRVERELRNDMAAARDPAPEARALAHRLSGAGDGLRYSTASAVFESGGRRAVMPGFQPFAVYEVLVANVAPGLERRSAPQSAEEVLAWAPHPLATAEVAELRGIGHDAARDELGAAGATFTAAAGDGYWSAG